MSWKTTLTEFFSKKYLNEIVSDIIKSYKKKKKLDVYNVNSQTIPYKVFVLFNPSELSSYSSPVKAIVEKGFRQNTFITDDSEQNEDSKEKSGFNLISKDDIEKISKKIANGETMDKLPDIENLLFRKGLDEKAFAWHQMFKLLETFPHEIEELKTEKYSSLKNGKILYWKKNFLNMNFRNHELFQLYLMSSELKPKRDIICNEFQCQNVYINRTPPFNWYLFLLMEKSGVLIAFQD